MPSSASVDSHPKYSEMILEAIRDQKKEGKLNVSRPAIQKFVTQKYLLDPIMANRHVNLNLKKMLESGVIKPAAPAGRKGAGSYRLGQSLTGKKTGAGEKKVTKTKEKKVPKANAGSNKGKKVAKAKTGSNKKIQGRKTEMSSKGKKIAGKDKAQKKAIKTPAKPKASRMQISTGR